MGCHNMKGEKNGSNRVSYVSHAHWRKIKRPFKQPPYYLDVKLITSPIRHNMISSCYRHEPVTLINIHLRRWTCCSGLVIRKLHITVTHIFGLILKKRVSDPRCLQWNTCFNRVGQALWYWYICSNHKYVLILE